VADSNKLIIEVEFDDGSIKKGYAKVAKGAKPAGEEAGNKFNQGLGGTLKKGLSTLKGSIAGIGTALVAALGAREAIQAAARQEEAVNRLNNSLKRIGEFSQQTSQDLQNYASELQSVTRFGDEAIIEQLAFAQGLGLTAQQSKDAVSAAVDLSTALGVDLNSAVRNVAKTVGGYAGELGEVIPSIKNLSAEQLKQGEGIKLIGDLYRGVAQRGVKGFNGSIDVLKNSFGDFLESIGNIIIKMRLCLHL
jgi:phage-related protein